MKALTFFCFLEKDSCCNSAILIKVHVYVPVCSLTPKFCFSLLHNFVCTSSTQSNSFYNVAMQYYFCRDIFSMVMGGGGGGTREKPECSFV